MNEINDARGPPGATSATCDAGLREEDNKNKQANDVDDPFEDAPIIRYTDDDAVADGVLKKFLTPQGRDTRHRITGNAYHELTEHHRPSYPEYDEAAFMRFYLAELIPLIPEALRVYEQNIGGGILTTDFDFRVRKFESGVAKQLWYIPNEIGGVTMMKPEDY